MLLEYISLHFGPTRSIYEFGIFTYGPICPSSSLMYVALLQYVTARRSGTLPPPELTGAEEALPACRGRLPAWAQAPACRGCLPARAQALPRSGFALHVHVTAATLHKNSPWFILQLIHHKHIDDLLTHCC